MDKILDNKPNFFIVGAPKSGTTNMSYYLMQHPQVFMPDELEPYYFSRLDIPSDYQRPIIRDKEKYLHLFKNAKNKKCIGESSPVYLYSPNAPSDMKDQFPNSKIIISLRNPIEIAYSQYLSLKNMGFHKKLSLSEFIELSEKKILKKEFFIDSILEAGFYSNHIKRFQNSFSDKQIKIIIFEEYIKNPTLTINSIFSFLEIDQLTNFKPVSKNSYRTPQNSVSKLILNNSLIRKVSRKLIPSKTRSNLGENLLVKESIRPKLNISDRERLKKIFRDDVDDLQKLLKLELPWSDFSNKQ